MSHSKLNSNGFTLVEVMIALLMSGVVVASIYSAFQSQQGTYNAQDQVAQMQQNLRAGLHLMMRDMRLAAYDPSGTGNYGILSADAQSFNFTADTNEDGGLPGSGETYLYELYGTDNDILRRTPGGGPVAEDIEEIEFYYTLKDGISTLAPGNIADIRSVQISLLVRADKSDREFANPKIYTTASGATWGAYNDNFRRRFTTLTVQCRNMGL